MLGPPSPTQPAVKMLPPSGPWGHRCGLVTISGRPDPTLQASRGRAGGTQRRATAPGPLCAPAAVQASPWSERRSPLPSDFPDPVRFPHASSADTGSSRPASESFLCCLSDAPDSVREPRTQAGSGAASRRAALRWGGLPGCGGGGCKLRVWVTCPAGGSGEGGGGNCLQLTENAPKSLVSGIRFILYIFQGANVF